MNDEMNDTAAETREFVTIMVGDHSAASMFSRCMILGPQKIARVPLASSEVAGLLNLREKLLRLSICAGVLVSRIVPREKMV